MIKIQLNNGDTFSPGQPIAGQVHWSDEDASQIEIRLIWFTRGKGDRDSDVIDRVAIEQPEHKGGHAFEFVAPSRPYSFSGKLISLTWAIEVIVFPDRRAERVEITVAPAGAEVLLNPTGEKLESKTSFLKLGN